MNNNKKIIKILKKLNIYRDLIRNKNYQYEISANNKVIYELETLDYDLTQKDNPRDVKGVGVGISKHITDILNNKNSRKTGIEELDNLSKPFMDQINKIFNENEEGKVEVADIIPRSVITKFDKYFSKNYEVDFIICGSYRRGNKTSGDIDVILYNDFDIKEFKDKFSLDKIFYEFLTNGTKKMSCIIYFSGLYINVDFMFLIDKRELPYSIFYFTGNKFFNINMKKIAKDMGYKLGNTEMIDDKGKNVYVKSEEEIFKKLKTDYVDPKDRNY
jgi:DNA polymerase/3'-5' exonuclease PolX